ncbi:protein-tyrosine phosphatase-like protein [Gongronella butleri]|nr:protein-tyrosine phosphatase-like protein [Gongronella butleri]
MISPSHSLMNFRDVGVSIASAPGGHPFLKEAMLTRSASMDGMTHEQVAEFAKKYQTRTILDLRTLEESRPCHPIDTLFPLQANEKEQRKVKISLVGRGFKTHYIFAQCSLVIKMVLIVLIVFCQRQLAAKVVAKHVLNPCGLSALYRGTINYSGKELAQALMLFTDASMYPIHVHCTQGKDRTGIIVALLLSICGVPEDLIVLDYARTQAGLAPIYDTMLIEVKRNGLSDEFMDASPQNMRGLLEFLKQEYGSVSGYLASIGFDKEHQDQVRAILCAAS